ncbi:hypothetical protein BZG35_04245 [Brevundimonas sp. LM2]|uniref:hypothetical protein n=1 Tax=Brevundimonas sp. LM2 TaxID=1938605 RepID=UPI000983AFD6|nr:hypothetical protein [Brevundimonas sp. LM2]AQR60953.1 hypothetical protein BZG35_04245 [Brevundimonas sp. LM2]
MRKTAPQRLAEREARARSELLDSLFDPWIGQAGNAATLDRLGPVDPLGAKDVARALRSDIAGPFADLTRETQTRIKAALTVLAKSDGAEFRAYWLDLRAPFGTTEEEADAIFPVVAKSFGVRLPETPPGS